MFFLQFLSDLVQYFNSKKKKKSNSIAEINFFGVFQAALSATMKKTFATLQALTAAVQNRSTSNIYSRALLTCSVSGTQEILAHAYTSSE